MDTCPVCGSTMYSRCPPGCVAHKNHDIRDGQLWRCLICAMRRVHEQYRQMKERSGPQYELSASRSRVGTAAYRAAGSPPKVSSAMVPVTFIERDGQLYGDKYEIRYYLAKSMRRGARPDEWIEATPEQVEAWAAWQRQKPTTSR